MSRPDRDSRLPCLSSALEDLSSVRILEEDMFRVNNSAVLALSDRHSSLVGGAACNLARRTQAVVERPPDGRFSCGITCAPAQVANRPYAEERRRDQLG